MTSIEIHEIFIALIAPIGVDLVTVRKSIETSLTAVSYRTHVIKLSDIIKTLSYYTSAQSNETGECQRFDKLMKAGDALREATRQGDALSKLAVREIVLKRPNLGIGRNAYIIDSIKNPEELRLLRGIYGKLLFSFAIIDSRENRLDNLAKKFCESQSSTNPDKYRAKAEEFVDRDYNTDGGKYKQNIRDVFPMADAFIKMDGIGEVLNKKIQRVIDALFGHPFITPTKDEYGMYLAKCASLRSSDLARQVGAALCTENGEVLALGCNEVPHPHGELMWGSGDRDRRDFVIGYDSTAKMKGQIISEVMKRLLDAGLLDSTKCNPDNITQVSQSLAFGELALHLKDARVSNIIEFGRVVHAEMTAITECSRRGIATKGQNLYCTTFPCHMCARHIVSSGIKSVYYIEPYPKSMAKDLYKDIVDVIDSSKDASDKVVNFISFEGIGPNRYMDIFELGERKRKTPNGDAVAWDRANGIPLVDHHNIFYTDIEKTTILPLEIPENRDKYGIKS